MSLFGIVFIIAGIGLFITGLGLQAWENWRIASRQPDLKVVARD